MISRHHLMICRSHWYSLMSEAWLGVDGFESVVSVFPPSCLRRIPRTPLMRRRCLQPKRTPLAMLNRFCQTIHSILLYIKCHYILFRTLDGAGKFLRFSTLNEISRWIWCRWAYSPFWYVFILLLVCVEMYFVLATSVNCPARLLTLLFHTLSSIHTKRHIIGILTSVSPRSQSISD
jgi:hypothetical protein